jgi:hypothetical protein
MDTLCYSPRCAFCGTKVTTPVGPVLSCEVDGISSNTCYVCAVKHAPEAVDKWRSRHELHRMIKAHRRGEQTPLEEYELACVRCGGRFVQYIFYDGDYGEVVYSTHISTASPGLLICRCEIPLEANLRLWLKEAKPKTNVIAFDQTRRHI